MVFWGYTGDPRGENVINTVPKVTWDQVTWCVLVPKAT